MADRPILFSAPMIRALLDGRKTQTRRVLCAFEPERDPPFAGPYISGHKVATWTDHEGTAWRYPGAKGAVTGDLLWVRERFAMNPAVRQPDRIKNIIYRADVPDKKPPESSVLTIESLMWAGAELCKWRPSIHMPRWASRLTLIVTDVRVQRLHWIDRGEAMAEGCPFANMRDGPNPRRWFADLWDTINGPGAWDANPWVVALTFNLHRCNIDRMPV